MNTTECVTKLERTHPFASNLLRAKVKKILQLIKIRINFKNEIYYPDPFRERRIFIGNIISLKKEEIYEGYIFPK